MKGQERVYKNNIYTHDDSSKVFIFAILVPFIMAFFADMIVGSIANGRGLEVDVIKASWAYNIIIMLITVLIYFGIWFVYNKIKDVNPKAVNFRAKQPFHRYIVVILLGMVALFGFQYVVQASEELMRMIGYPINETFGSVDPETIGEYIYCIFGLALIPAVCEELLFRGVIFNGLRERFSTGGAMILSSVMFAFAHQNLQQLIYPIVFGCVLAWIVARTGSLFLSMLVHFFNNLVVVTFRFIENTTGFTLKLANTWHLYAIAAGTAVAALIIFLLFDKFYFKRKNNDNPNRSSGKVSVYLYISLAIGFAMFAINVVGYVLSNLNAA